MRVAEFAEIFGMTVSELSDYTGYSRKTLYNIFRSGNRCNNRRLTAMLRQLRIKSIKDLTDGKERLENQYQQRLDALEMIESEKTKTG